MRRRLKVFAGAEHPHTAQSPKALEVKSRRTTR
jgi:ribosomal protein L13